MDRVTLYLIRRYREQALDAAALVAALATATLFDEHSALHELSTRQDDQLNDLLHDFAYKARKTVELSRAAGFSAATSVERESVAGVAKQANGLGPVTMYSLWFILNRVIHSVALEIQHAHVPHSIGETVVHPLSAWAFTVRSDRDDADAYHLIFIEFLVEAYLELDAQLLSELQAVAPG